MGKGLAYKTDLLQGRVKKHPKKTPTGSFDTGLWLWTSLRWGTLFGRFGGYPVYCRFSRCWDEKNIHRSRVIVVAKKRFLLSLLHSILLFWLVFFIFSPLFHRCFWILSNFPKKHSKHARTVNRSFLERFFWRWSALLAQCIRSWRGVASYTPVTSRPSWEVVPWGFL